LRPAPFSAPSPLKVDDLCDSGLTLVEVSKAVAAAGAASVKTLVLLDKQARRKVEIKPDYIGFDVSGSGCFGKRRRLGLRLMSAYRQ
jgi:hypoxanthine phosphoribosyltransferase